MQRKSNGLLIVIVIAIAAIIASIMVDKLIIEPKVEEKRIEAELAKEQKKQKEKEEKEENKQQEEIKREEEEENKTENLITSINDISENVLSKANEYIMDDLNSKLSTEDNILRILGEAINSNPKVNISQYLGDYTLNVYYTDSYNVGEPKLSSIYLFIPKDNDTVGVLRFNYQFNFDVSGYGNLSMEEENYHTYNGLIANIPYYYLIDLSNKELPISDYTKYEYESEGCDIDFDNWYAKNVTQYKNNYTVEEALIQ